MTEASQWDMSTVWQRPDGKAPASATLRSFLGPQDRWILSPAPAPCSQPGPRAGLGLPRLQQPPPRAFSGRM